MASEPSPILGRFDKVTIITGGSKGIGLGCARAFVEAGGTVVICARGAETGEAVAVELTAKGPGACHFEPCDVTKPASIQQVIGRTVELYGRLDCLLNNAGWHPEHRPIDGFSIEEFESLLRLNVVSYFAACKYALPYLRQTRGSIINISSLVGSIGQEWATTYVATKGAITAMTKALAVDEARHGVRVNAVLPGAVDTPLVRTFIDSKPNAFDLREMLGNWSWMGRLATADELGRACLFLASDMASFITGVELSVSGGCELAYGTKYPKDESLRLL